MSYNFLRLYFTNVHIKLECLLLASLFKALAYARHLSGTLLLGTIQALPTNIRLGCKSGTYPCKATEKMLHSIVDSFPYPQVLD